jgi:nitroimidazol reductase NimA-like FMN-containing flavoprotein (pyridoxamine 5'-phosphate oxidase superfamily)
LLFYLGMSKVRSNSAWNTQQINDFLSVSLIPVRLACTDKKGVPLICSLWYLYTDAVLWCATQQSASVVALLKRSPQCAFEIAPEAMPYKGVRGQGHATLLPAEGPAVLQQLIDRYLGARDTKFAAWLMSRSAMEVAIRIEPEWLNSWDFSSRMQP